MGFLFRNSITFSNCYDSLPPIFNIILVRLLLLTPILTCSIKCSCIFNISVINVINKIYDKYDQFGTMTYPYHCTLLWVSKEALAPQEWSQLFKNILKNVLMPKIENPWLQIFFVQLKHRLFSIFFIGFPENLIRYFHTSQWVKYVTFFPPKVGPVWIYLPEGAKKIQTVLKPKLSTSYLMPCSALVWG